MTWLFLNRSGRGELLGGTLIGDSQAPGSSACAINSASISVFESVFELPIDPSR
jgi:hypothetical protein